MLGQLKIGGQRVIPYTEIYLIVIPHIGMELEFDA
jgi:hypothetical protein